MIRVLLVDDHRIMLDGLELLIASSDDITVIGKAETGAAALELFRELQPDVSVVDLRMRPMDGIELTRHLRQLSPTARVILLTTYDTDEEIFLGFSAGIATYLLKDIASDTLLDSIRQVYAGKRVVPPAIAAKLAEHVAQEALTARQREVLRLAAEGKSNEEIGTQLFISAGTVKAHMRSILSKLAARDRTQAIATATRRGILRPE
jgi:two-component system, NarL family, response regulator